MKRLFFHLLVAGAAVGSLALLVGAVMLVFRVAQPPENPIDPSRDPAGEVAGRVAKVESGTILVSSEPPSSGLVPLVLTRDTMIMVGSSAGWPTDIRPGGQIKVVYDLYEGKRLARSVQVITDHATRRTASPDLPPKPAVTQKASDPPKAADPIVAEKSAKAATPSAAAAATPSPTAITPSLAAPAPALPAPAPRTPAATTKPTPAPTAAAPAPIPAPAPQTVVTPSPGPTGEPMPKANSTPPPPPRAVTAAPAPSPPPRKVEPPAPAPTPTVAAPAAPPRPAAAAPPSPPPRPAPAPARTPEPVRPAESDATDGSAAVDWLLRGRR